jgi:hypothetical protein
MRKHQQLRYSYDDDHDAVFIFIRHGGDLYLDEAYIITDVEEEVVDDDLLKDTDRWDELTDWAWKDVSI